MALGSRRRKTNPLERLKLSLESKQTVILTRIEKAALKAVLSECELARDRLQNAAHQHQEAEKQRSEVVRDILAAYGYAETDELTTSPKELFEGGLVHLERKSPIARKEKEDGT